jgi:hypothetical protein
VSRQLRAPAALLTGKSRWYLSDRRLGGLERQSARSGEEKNFVLPRIKLRPFCLWTVGILTELS